MIFKKFRSVDEMLKDLKYERPDSYIGPDFYEYIDVMGRNRDSRLLDNYNYEAVKEHLKKFMKDNKIPDTITIEGEEQDILMDIRQGHWACGYIELLKIHVGADNRLLVEVMEILNALDDYPVFDDLEYSEYCHDRLVEYMESNYSWDMRDLKDYLGLGDSDNPRGLDRLISYVYQYSSEYHGEDDAYFDVRLLSKTITWAENNGLKISKRLKKLIAEKSNPQLKAV